MLDFFRRHVIPELQNVHHVEFITASPGVSASAHWASIEAQIQQLKFSSIKLDLDPDARRVSGITENVARLALDLGHLSPGIPISVELDGQQLGKIDWPSGRRIWLTREQGKWSYSGQPSYALKGPDRYGPFKEAFRNRVQFVYGTQGNREENKWTYARARFDAETFWYRGNGSVDVIPDAAFDAGAEPNRNVILYGNADTNAAWKPLLADGPVQVGRGVVRIADRHVGGSDLACLFLRPRPGSDRAVVGVVAGTSVVGLRLTEQFPYFASGVACPDCIVAAPEILTKGTDGIRAAGFFGLDWSVNKGEFVFTP